MSHHRIRRAMRATGHALWTGLEMNGAALAGAGVPSAPGALAMRCASPAGCPQYFTGAYDSAGQPVMSATPPSDDEIRAMLARSELRSLLDEMTPAERQAMHDYNQGCDGSLPYGPPYAMPTPQESPRDASGYAAGSFRLPASAPDPADYSEPLMYSLALQRWQEDQDAQATRDDAALMAGWSADAWERDAS